MSIFIEQLSQLLDQKYILTEDQGKAPYLTDWRKRFSGKALARKHKRGRQYRAALRNPSGIHSPTRWTYRILWWRHPPITVVNKLCLT